MRTLCRRRRCCSSDSSPSASPRSTSRPSGPWPWRSSREFSQSLTSYRRAWCSPLCSCSTRCSPCSRTSLASTRGCSSWRPRAAARERRRAHCLSVWPFGAQRQPARPKAARHARLVRARRGTRRRTRRRTGATRRTKAKARKTRRRMKPPPASRGSTTTTPAARRAHPLVPQAPPLPRPRALHRWPRCHPRQPHRARLQSRPSRGCSHPTSPASPRASAARLLRETEPTSPTLRRPPQRAGAARSSPSPRSRAQRSSPPTHSRSQRTCGAMTCLPGAQRWTCASWTPSSAATSSLATPQSTISPSFGRPLGSTLRAINGCEHRRRRPTSESSDDLMRRKLPRLQR
mmetsp:Transcript_21819/g.67921  ORF Transcript_21819/g.67921 Transcript_21819/m.67921 type:complete len:346 (-) Transcript_21819:312-1349(-)